MFVLGFVVSGAHKHISDAGASDACLGSALGTVALDRYGHTIWRQGPPPSGQLFLEAQNNSASCVPLAKLN